MHRRSLRRAAALGLTASLAVAGLAFADQIVTDGDAVASGQQTTVDIGTVTPGAIIPVAVTFELRCTGSSHVDPGQMVTLSKFGSSAPPGGSVVSVTDGTIGPVPADWPADTTLCPDPSPRSTVGTASVVTIQAPTAVNVGYTYTVGYTRSFSPAGGSDGSAVPQVPSITIKLAVSNDTPPVLTIPGDHTVEADTVAGWTATYPGVSATDTEDDPDPTPSCFPAPTTVLPLGTTTVTCEVADSAGHHVSDDFAVTVVDTTAPTIGAVADLTAETTDPTGTAVSFADPSASDIVDPGPVVGCLPASGSTFPLGMTTVTCTATDGSGNHAATSFTVTVTRTEVPPSDTATAHWLSPLGLDAGGTAAVQAGSNVPLKLTFLVDGEVARTGQAGVVVTPCSGGAPTVLPLASKGGTWTSALKTSAKMGSCLTLAATIDGLDAGAITLQLKGAEPVKAPQAKARPGKTTIGHHALRHLIHQVHHHGHRARAPKHHR